MECEIQMIASLSQEQPHSKERTKVGENKKEMFKSPPEQQPLL